MTIEPIDMVAPQDIPSEERVAAWLAAGALAVADMPAGGGRGLAQDSSPGEVANLLKHIAVPENCVARPNPDVNDAAHDAYFHVRRVAGDNTPIFVRTALRARSILSDEAAGSPFADPPLPWQQMDSALADLVASLTGGPGGRSATSSAAPAAVPRDVLRRWVRGHQVFAALTQGLVFALLAMSRAIRAGKGEDVRHWADLSVSLLRGSGAAFVFTGEFSVEEYTDVVRPSMMPPATAVPLSGLMSADHSYLVHIIREMRPALKALGDMDAERLARIHAEMALVYDNHVHVCEQFVGHQPSLLTAGRTEKSGPALIAQFKTLRLKPFGHQQHAARLTSESHSEKAGRCPVAK